MYQRITRGNTVELELELTEGMRFCIVRATGTVQRPGLMKFQSNIR